MRYSHQRETIRRIVYSTNTHPTADWIFSKSKKEIPDISLGTVYRNLKQLNDEDITRTIYDGSIARYDWNMDSHDHLKCKKCGNLIDVQLPEPDIKRKVKKKYNFKVDGVEMTLIGTCSKHT